MSQTDKEVLSEAVPPNSSTASGNQRLERLPVIAVDMPVMFEDEGQEEMGDSTPHTRSLGILFYGLMAHLASQAASQVLANLNLYYHPTERWAYLSPDVMVVRPPARLPEDLASYRIGQEGPAPILVAEVLSRRTFQQQDLTNKPRIYAQLGVAEYLLVDPTGIFLPEQLLLKEWQPDETWINRQDADGGITSRLGFRVVLEADGQIRVVNSATGLRYVRPEEGQQAANNWQAEAEARRLAEERVRALEAELARLRGNPPATEPDR